MHQRVRVPAWVVGLTFLGAAGIVALSLKEREAGPATLASSFRAVPGESRELGWPSESIALEVNEVLAGGPSATAGLQSGDRLVSIDGGAITSECALTPSLDRLTIGHKVEVVIERRGGRKTLEIEPAAASGLFETLCTAGDPRACRERAKSLARIEGDPLLEGACSKGDGVACRHLGDRLSEGATADLGRARRLYGNACDEGDAAGCTRLGFLYSVGQGVERDDTKATNLFDIACRAGDAAGCYNVGLMYANVRGTVRNDARALLGYVRGCALGFAQACTNLGYLYEHGHGLIASAERAAKLYERACQGFACQPADPISCTNLGVYARDGLGGVARDPSRAASLFTRACEASQASGCTNLGRLEEDGQGVVRNITAAAEHYRRGCELGSAGGCRNVAGTIREGLVPAADDGELSRLLARACELGDERSCRPSDGQSE